MRRRRLSRRCGDEGLSYLLKIKRTAMEGVTAIVPRMKSARLDDSDIGTRIFIWLDDQPTATGHLASTSILTEFEEIRIAQVRDPSKAKDAYRLTLAAISSNLALPLTTDDLERYRYSEGASALETLGRIHRDRNDKIIRLSELEEAELNARFRQ